MNKFIACAALTLAVPVAANATITTFTGADDGAAVGGTFANSDAAAASFFAAALPYSFLVTTGFETTPVGFSTSYALPFATLSLSATDYGAGYSGVSNTTFGNLYGFDIGSGTGKWLGFPDGSATFSFAGVTHAFGFYTTGVQTTFGTSFTVTYSDGSAQSFDVPVNVNGGVSFFGLVDTAEFASITISRPGGDAWGIDNVSYGFPMPATVSVPEPATWAMFIGGFGMIGGAMRRRRTTKVSFA